MPCFFKELNISELGNNNTQHTIILPRVYTKSKALLMNYMHKIALQSYNPTNIYQTILEIDNHKHKIKIKYSFLSIYGVILAVSKAFFQQDFIYRVVYNALPRRDNLKRRNHINVSPKCYFLQFRK